MRAGERFKGGLKRAMRRAAEVSIPAAGARSVILTYHSVGRRDHEMNVTPDVFAEQARWLADHAHIISASRAARGETGIALTFDDGYRDNLLEAAPVLARYGITATVFVVAGRAGGHLDHDSRHDESARLMTWDEVRELMSGGWEIGGHTLTHCRLSGQNQERQNREISGCKSVIEDQTGIDVSGFAYPYGSALDYDQASMRAAREAGYEYAVSNRYGVNDVHSDCFSLRRIWIDRTDSLASFAAKVEGRLDRLSWLDSGPGIRARRWANRLLRSA